MKLLTLFPLTPHLYRLSNLEFMSIVPGIFRATSEELNFNACFYVDPPIHAAEKFEDPEQLTRRVQFKFESTTHSVSLLQVYSLKVTENLQDPYVVVLEMSVLLQVAPRISSAPGTATLGTITPLELNRITAEGHVRKRQILCELILNAWSSWPGLFPGRWQSRIYAEQLDIFLPLGARRAIAQAAQKPAVD